jgi:glycosyltransferase involved in cell wall biosynthesis
MRLLVLNYEYPPIGGGAGVVSENVCNFLSSRKIIQTIITSWLPGLKFYERDGNITIIRVPTLKLSRHKTTFIGMFSYILSAFLPMMAVIIFRRINIIHSHFAVPVGVLAYGANLILKIPYVITLHGGDVPGMVPEQTDAMFRLIKPFARKIINRASMVTTVSSGLRELALKSYSKPIQVIPNGIDGSLILNRLENSDRQKNNISLLFAGRFTKQKNIDSIIKAMRIIEGTSLKCALDILGDGPLKSELERESTGIKGITFHGWVAEKEVREMMLETDIFILPSFSEGLSVACLHAMSQGCALVLSNIPMNLDLLDEGKNGYFASHDPQSVASAILRCSESLERLKQGSLEKVREFTWDKIGPQYEKLFLSIVKNL